MSQQFSGEQAFYPARGGGGGIGDWVYLVESDGAQATVYDNRGAIVSGPGVNDETQINWATANLTVGRNRKETVKVVGDYATTAPMPLPSYCIFDITEAYFYLANGSDCDVIENDDQVAGNDHIEVKGGILDCNKANQASGNGLHFYMVSYSLIEEMIVLNADDDGIRVEGTGVGTDSVGNVIFNNRVEESDQDNFSLNRSQRIRIIGNYGYEGGRYNFLLNILRAQIVVSDCIGWESTDRSFYISISEGHVDNCTAYGSNIHGFAFFDNGGLSLSNCSAYGNVQSNIHVETLVDLPISITDGYYVGSSTGNDNTYDSLVIETDGCIVSNNLILFELANRPRHAVYVTADDVIIQGNYIAGVRSEGIHFEGANDGLILGNRIVDVGTYAIELDADSDDNYIQGNYTSGSTTGCVNVANANCNNNDFSGGNKFTELGFVDSGTGTIFQIEEWLVTYGAGGITLTGDVPLAAITNGESAAVGFHCPTKLQQLVHAYLMVLPNATQANADWDLNSDYGKVGEAPNTHSEVDAGTTYNVTNNLWYDIELVALGFFANLTINDRGGIRLTVSTAGHDASLFGLRFEYV